MQTSGIFKMLSFLLVIVGSALLFTSCTSPSTHDSQSVDNEYERHKGHGGYGGLGGAGGR